ncbi:MAG: endonuclease NucS [Nitrososphaerota archaeon]
MHNEEAAILEAEVKEFTLLIERDTQNYIVSKANKVEKGLSFQRKEYETPVGRIDVLCIDKDSN